MTIGIIGSGTMGAGIAQVAAQAGNQVILVDTNPVALEKASTQLKSTLSKLVEKGKLNLDAATALEQNIRWETSITSLTHAELVIEAIVEKLEIKQSVFTELEKIVSDTCILASNTSSLSLTSIAGACGNASRVIGIHFFNPAPLMELVEIIPALQTNPEVVSSTETLIKSWNKKTVLARDTPGFIVNRIARPYYSESIRILEEGIASLETIDYALKLVGQFRMGPFELMDLIGHDVNYAVTESVWSAFYFDQKYTPSFTQKRLVEARWLGRKSGRGFNNYAEGTEPKEPDMDHALHQKIFLRVWSMLVHEAANAFYLKIANVQDIDLAMTKGVNYPKGLLKWADEIGIGICVDQLDAMYNLYHEDRYRCSPLLRQMKENNQTFY